MPTSKELTGLRFGKLVVMGRAGTSKNNRAVWRCVCDCGAEVIVDTVRLTTGKKRSCGCLAREQSAERAHSMAVHGMYKSRPFRIWHGMKQRCLNPNAPRYKYYGGKGISVYAKWLDFVGFWEDMQNGYADNLTLDRIDVNGNYEPENCRWITQQEQMENTTRNVWLTIDGVTDIFKNHCKRYGICYSTAMNRVSRHGYTYEEAVVVPVKTKFSCYATMHPKEG